MITLSLCTYTALHLKIPPPGSTKRSVYLHKARWVLEGVFAPELVAYTAWAQWDTARKLTVEVNGIFQSQVSSTRSSS